MIDSTDPRYPRVYQDVIAHSVTGEAVGIEHYSRMIPLARSIDERLDLLEDAYHEKLHLLSMREVADRLQVPVKADLDGPYCGAYATPSASVRTRQTWLAVM
jgi:hypothetical protein